MKNIYYILIAFIITLWSPNAHGISEYDNINKSALVGTDELLLETSTGYNALALSVLQDWSDDQYSANIQTLLSSADFAAIRSYLDIDDLTTLSGVALSSTTLGTFTGSTIADSQTIKGALQALETAIEAVPGVNEGTPDAAGEFGYDSGSFIFYGASSSITLKPSDHWQSVYVHPSAFRVDGTNCAAVSAAQINSGPYLYSTACTDAAGTIYAQIAMPDNWDGGNVYVEPLVYSTQATPSGTVEFEISVQARGNDETVNNTWVTSNGNVYFEDAVTAGTTIDTQYDCFKARNATAMAAAGGGGDLLIVRLTRDNDDATHDTSTQAVSIAGFRLFYQVDALSEKD